jgi:hypothetical protein
VNRRLVVAEWARAQQSLSAARVLLRASGYAEQAVGASYYAIFHAAKAALAVDDIATSTHAGLRSMFGLHLVKTGRIEPEWAADLGLSPEDRVEADYNVFAHFSDEDADDQLARATAFLERIRKYLLTKGLTENELSSTPETR